MIKPIWNEDISPEELNKSLKEQKINFEDFSNGIFIATHKEDRERCAFGFFGSAFDIAVLLVEIESKLPKDIKTIRNVLLREKINDRARTKSLGAEAPAHCRIH